MTDLTFSNTEPWLFEKSVAHLLEHDMSVHEAGTAAAIRIEVPPFLIADGLVIGLPKVKGAFEAASRLIALYRRASAELDEAARSATPALRTPELMHS